MLKLKRTRRTMQARGFALLELMMVVIIIAILASMALPQYFRVTERARGSEVLSMLGAIRAAQMRYRAQNLGGQYTGALGDIDIDITRGPDGWAAPTLSAAGTTGMITSSRSGGQFTGQTVGITYGTGTVCGGFAPLFPAAVACVAD